MIKSVLTVGVVAGIAASLLMPTDVAARGMGAHHAHVFHHRAFWPYGGWVAAYRLGQDVAPVSAVIAQAPHCIPSRKTIMVPSEDGGERQITITRC